MKIMLSVIAQNTILMIIFFFHSNQINRVYF